MEWHPASPRHSFHQLVPTSAATLHLGPLDPEKDGTAPGLATPPVPSTRIKKLLTTYLILFGEWNWREARRPPPKFSESRRHSVDDRTLAPLGVRGRAATIAARPLPPLAPDATPGAAEIFRVSPPFR